MRREFVGIDPATYAVKSSGDESPREDRLVLGYDRVDWVLSHSHVHWLVFKGALRAGDHWQHRLRRYDLQYEVVAAGLAVSVPAGTFFELCQGDNQLQRE
jgi:hypothetical protein